MHRTFQSTCSTLVSNEELVIEVEQPHVPQVAVELTLLLLEEISSLLIICADKVQLKLKVSEKLRPGDKAIFSGSGQSFTVELSKTQLETMCSFFLRTYRDDMAEVTHFHIEGENNRSLFDLTFLFDTSAPPLTAEQAAKLMAD